MHAADSMPSHAHSTPSLERLQALVRHDLMQVNNAMIAALEGDVPLIQDLSRHIIAAGGKRIRPSLVLACTQLFTHTTRRHVPLAACVEFIHTATLLHDDVVDESNLRRGEPTANALFGNKASVLVGDYLLSRAFQMMVADGSLDVLRILSDAAAIISRGEVAQLMVAHNPQATEEEYFSVIGAKTAALFAAACEIGPVVADKPEHREALRQYGYNLGVAFQLIDDALDYMASTERLGKDIGDDFRDGKITLPVILAYNAGDDGQRQFWQRTLGDGEIASHDLAHALSLLEEHRTLRITIERARDYGASAIRLLDNIPHSDAKQALIDTVHFCIDRDF